MKTAEIFNATVAIGATVNGSIFAPTAKHNEDAMVQVSMSTTATVSVQARSTPTAPWVNVRLTPAGDTNFVTAGYGTIPLFPEMRVNVVGGVASSNIVVWLVD